MPVLVTIRHESGHRTLEADGIERDRLLSGNLVLGGVKNLELAHPQGGNVPAYLWSIPEALVVSYALVKTSLPAAGTPEPEAPSATRVTDENLPG